MHGLAGLRSFRWSHGSYFCLTGADVCPNSQWRPQSYALARFAQARPWLSPVHQRRRFNICTGHQSTLSFICLCAHAGDVITAVGGRRVRNTFDLSSIIDESAVGSTVAVTVLRGVGQPVSDDATARPWHVCMHKHAALRSTLLAGDLMIKAGVMLRRVLCEQQSVREQKRSLFSTGI